MARFVLIVARTDVAVAFRNELETAHGGKHGKLSATAYRRSGDAPHSVSHYVAHGRFEDRVWDAVVDALNTASSAVRDSVDWQGKPGTDVADADWAVAYDGADVVAGFRVTKNNGVTDQSPHDVLAALGLVLTAADTVHG